MSSVGDFASGASRSVRTDIEVLLSPSKSFDGTACEGHEFDAVRASVV